MLGIIILAVLGFMISIYGLVSAFNMWLFYGKKQPLITYIVIVILIGITLELFGI